jgi:ABC-2 type transport system ATP-binding protein
MDLAVSVRNLSVQYGRRLAFQDVSFDLAAGQAAGVIGPNGSGKTTLLRTIAGCLTPRSGEIRINGLTPRDALARTGVAYFAGDATLPGAVRAAGWGSLGNGDSVTHDRRPLRALSRGTRQLLGLRTALGRQPLGLVLLDEPWEGLDPDAGRWLTTIIETKRDRGAAVVLSSHRLHDLAGLCDVYLVLLPHQATVLRAHEITPAGPVTAEHLVDVFDRLRGGTSARHRRSG